MDAYTRRTLLHGFKARHFRDYEITPPSPWTARYSRRRYPSFLLRYEISDIDMYSFWRSSIDTAIVPLPVKVFLAGIPLTPVSRIAGAVFHAASNPDPETNGCAWLLLDNGPVFRVEPDSFKQGVYKMINDRMNVLFKWVEFQPGPGTYWVTWCEKWYNWRPLLSNFDQGGSGISSLLSCLSGSLATSWKAGCYLEHWSCSGQTDLGSHRKLCPIVAWSQDLIGILMMQFRKG